jgi:hypothetical protein
MLDITDIEEDEDETEGLTGADIVRLGECLASRLEDDEDDGGPEDVMTSLGYVQLWCDGDVVQHGTVIYKLEGGE